MLYRNKEMSIMNFLRAISPEKGCTMQQLTAILLRRAWKRRGNDPCLHPAVEPEYDQAVPTGSTVCLVCGGYVDGPPRRYHAPVVDRPV